MNPEIMNQNFNNPEYIDDLDTANQYCYNLLMNLNYLNSRYNHLRNSLGNYNPEKHIIITKEEYHNLNNLRIYKNDEINKLNRKIDIITHSNKKVVNRYQNIRRDKLRLKNKLNTIISDLNLRCDDLIREINQKNIEIDNLNNQINVNLNFSDTGNNETWNDWENLDSSMLYVGH